jgi:hypothetical protein
MTPDQMRVAIAEDQGWKQLTVEETVMHYPGGMQPAKFKRWFLNEKQSPMLIGGLEEPPDYPSDLNACHEFEEKIPHKQSNDYLAALSRVVDATSIYMKDVICATALQRCEAYCRMKGWWK